MPIVSRPSRSASLLGGAISLPRNTCAHAPARQVTPWTGEPGTAGTVAVVGAGKMGLPLCAFFCTLLITGWAVGLMICALIFRWGQGAEGMAWGAVFEIGRAHV